MKAIDKLHEISKKLAPCGIEAAQKEAELFIRQGLDIDPVQLYRDNPELKEEQTIAIEGMVNRRSKREPLQYILGCTDFSGLKILVGHGVLIPRPETELMAEYAVKAISGQRSAISRESEEDKNNPPIPPLEKGGNGGFEILDLCTGSGCLALALAKEFPNSQVFGTDISETALDHARKNAGLNKINNVRFFNGHLFGPLKKTQPFDFIISNPPYIRTNDINGLQPEIRHWEPLSALDGGADGLDFYREIIPAARQFLKDSGILMFELGADCADAVAGMFKHAGYTRIQTLKDYAGIKRVIQAVWTR